MILVCERDKKSIEELINLFKVSKENPKLGLVNYTVPVCLVKAKILSVFDIKQMDDRYVIVCEWAVYSIDLGSTNDSPGAKLITEEEHKKNCDKIIKELEGMMDIL